MLWVREGVLSRYHFNVFDGHSTVEPHELDLPDVGAARREGIRRAGAALVLDAHKLQPGGEWRLEVTDERALVLFRMDFAISASPAARHER